MKRILSIIISILSFTAVLAQRQNVECEDTCSHIHGIDLSHYQGNVFWEAVGQANVSYVYLKATEGGDRIDDKYKQNIDLAHQYGLKVGSYHFYRPKINQQTQLDNFMAQCRPGDQDLIPMVDVETRSGLSVEDFRDSLFTFLHLMEQAYKQKPLIYTGANFYDANLLGQLGDYKVMIAQYTAREPVLKDDLDFIIWQYTGKGRLNGINGHVDKSRFMGTHKLREIRFRHK
ncbi:MAG: glycosyl hydrolase family 25 [Prevotella sp.]|nr:glycosyl hydrolase family 25 [Prevotella sp.]